MFSHPELGSKPPIGSDRESGCYKACASWVQEAVASRSDAAKFLSLPSRPEDIKHILHCWKPFNQGESAADRLDDLYLRTLRMPVTVRASGLGEEYSVVVPAGTGKKDLQQIVKDGMQIHNRNYVQST